jgi:hypothetical protein
MKLRLLVCGILLSTCSGHLVAESKAVTSPAFSLKIEAVKPTLSLSQGLFIKITLANTSDNPIFIPMDNGYKAELDYRVIVLQPDGSEAPQTELNEALQGHGTQVLDLSTHHELIAPSASILAGIDLGKLYNITSPGTYSVTVEHWDPYSKSLVKSNTIAVSVVP